ncbi:hypothetical protein PAQU9191_03942 [Photobacterium aquimaris]|uniref:Uncharacterized protein n=1 Tax=Photobacterium aquimaris TaxID=512643 RepID=A0A1Y6L2Q2_9GAMM|nr:hypothetical protein PAQU9191_03942 [Photobacterium aquimaris]
MINIPAIGTPALFVLAKILGNRPSSAAALETCALVNCQPSSEPIHAITAARVTMLPTIGLNMWLNTRPNGAVDADSSALGIIP